ncbi:cytochrome b [Pseudoxanthomonas sp. X-1]|uniref:cytochrome b n=1 Tax=Pseudoxanthomonas sp. X-1 TaxID=2571115 RepID=UPI00110BE66A|nr:cytochrome b [Pseudoxanthomonas sp. X-1]TMN17583.1 cytochrome b [Pseudoxanthomonas sp. X-1]UAY75706.1 cytochrome b [Pseudoxanthomonas sp. X-1]
MTRANAQRWGAVSQTLHWLILLLLLVLCVVGLTLDDLPRTPKYFWVYTAHKSLGITVLVLVAMRLAWRLYAGAPPPVPGTPRWQHAIATLTHVLLYAVMFAMPLSGWLYDSASGLRPFKFFGLFDMPKLVAPDEHLRHLAHSAHEWGLYVLIVLVVLHAGAALYHHLFQGDATLARMLPRGWLRVSAQPKDA